MLRLIYAIVAILAFGQLAGYVMRDDTLRPAAAAPAKTLGPVQFSRYQAKEMIQAVLKDPGSAVFENVRYGTIDSVCGLVNAKGGFGGYTGRRPFIVVRPNLVFIEDGDTKTFRAAYRKYCP